MNPRHSTILGGVVIVLLAGATAFSLRGLLASRAAGKAPDQGNPPVQVERVLQEGELNRITLSKKAVARINIRIAQVEKRKIDRARVVGGDVIAPMGQESVVAAPLAGRLESPGGSALRPGQAVTAGQVVFKLHPQLSPEARTTIATSLVEAEGQVNTAETQLGAARIALKRAETLKVQEAG